MEKQPAFNCTEHKGTKDLVTLLNDAVTEYIQEKIQVSRKESKIREIREVNIKKLSVKFDKVVVPKYNNKE